MYIHVWDGRMNVCCETWYATMGCEVGVCEWVTSSSLVVELKSIDFHFNFVENSQYGMQAPIMCNIAMIE